ncbi:PhoD-like phosphatase [Colletotrichum paranaense]|uniref:PhoD-like phosphatase n=1 Tax=Colletotrichum paranaense TaxID=1914294 RepID=A0ABQ9SVQ7_9PEZI|nr:PhoD-like phosphatase [Colletotrichum paranaense]KAK1543601.1 PhoD-like phosphatase [Colletotrichum paranaense]
MHFLKSLCTASLAAVATSTYAGNLNYGSPSLHHPFLGISIRKVASRSEGSSPWTPEQLNFTHGVASGDPYDDSVILWTRVAPTLDNDRSNVTVEGTAPMYAHDNDVFVKASKSPICVDWKIGRSASMDGQPIKSGTAYTSSDVDFTVKVEAKALKPFTVYYYQFNVCDSDVKSPVGRTRTLPESGTKVRRAIKLAVYSCANYPFGFFNAYGNPERKDSVDYIVHLGDYIYEYGNGEYPVGGLGWGNSIGRVPEPNRSCHTLYDYRRRLAQYRSDPDLRASHQKFPWITVWDDHEVMDNPYRDGSAAMNNTEQSFIKDDGISVEARKMNAVRAYFEWMPLRQVDMDDNLRIWRSFHFGDLFNLIMLDTRNYDRSITDLYWNTGYVHTISDDTSRSLMGSRQENWFYRQLIESASTTRWRVVGNQVVFSKMNQSISNGPKNPFNYDQWDGYAANRNRTLKTLYDNSIDNTVFLAGDSHASWVSDLVWLGEKDYNSETGAGSIGVEFAGTAVTSPSSAGQNITQEKALNRSAWMTAANPELQWQEYYYRGYFEMTIDYDAVNATFFGLPTYATRNGLEIALANFTVLAGENKLRRPVGGGSVEFGNLKGGVTKQTNLTNDTNTGEWSVFESSKLG